MWFILLACAPDATGPLPLWDLAGELYDAPWPSDDRATPTGAPDLATFPNPEAVALLDLYTEAVGQLDGAGLASPVYVPFDGPIDVSRLPDPPTSTTQAASVFLLDVDPDSPARGTRVPLAFDWQADWAPYMEANLLAAAPVFGVPLAPRTTYALVVTTDLARPHPGLADSLAADDRWLETRNTLESIDFPLDRAAMVVRLTTQDATRELAEYAWWIRANLPPTAIAPDLVTTRDFGGYTRYEGHLWLPVWQAGERPYATEGGALHHDPAGSPAVWSWDWTAFSLSVPDGDAPAGGWPVVLCQHGTGGDHESCASSASSRETAALLAAEGIATFGIAQPLHGDRATPDTLTELHTFNYANPEAARATFRQGALDAVYTAHLLAGVPQVFLADDGREVPLDPGNVSFFGHSQGGITGAMALPWVGDLVRGAALSGAGGGMSLTLLLRKEGGLDIEALLTGLLDLDPGDLDVFHPIVALVQTLVDVTDPLHYAAGWFHAPAALGGPPLSVLLTEGMDDAHTPPLTTEALAAAARVPVLQPVEHLSDAHRVLGLDSVAVGSGLSANAPDFHGGAVTAGLAQYPGYDHFVVYDLDEAAARVQHFLATAAAGAPEIR